MVRKSLNVRYLMSMIIMHLNFLKEKGNLKEDLDLEDLEIAYMLMKKKRKNLIIVEVKTNWDL